MPEKVKVTVRASGAHPDILTVQDAMRQVLDIFDLLSAGTDAMPSLEWRLAKATTNSPFYLEGEAVSLEPGIDVSVIARAQKQTCAKWLREIVRGIIPDELDSKSERIAKRIFHRNLNGVGSTNIDLEIGEPIIVTPSVAQIAIGALEKAKPLGLFDIPSAREEIGSIEGTLHEVGTHWNHPAVRILENKTKDHIWCRLSADLLPHFSDKTTFADIWEHRRVFVRGLIKYDESGVIEYVLANDIQHIKSTEISLDDLRDTEFTGGLSIAEYLDRFRDGSLG